MYSIDPRLRGLPASREQVVSLFQSINYPHLAIPGKQAGPAQAWIVGLRGSGGYAVYVYLYLAEAQDCAVYASGRRNLSEIDFTIEEQEAHAFVESMGFMMDDTNFRALGKPDQEALMKSLPVFQREPPKAQPKAEPAEEKASSSLALGKLLASF